MGGDGGTIISRRDCMRFNKGRKENNLSKDMRRMTKWLNCSLSQESLHKPICACRLGRLYNKDRLIEHLLNRHSTQTTSSNTSATEETQLSHVKSLKDVRELSVCENVQRDHLLKGDVTKKSNASLSQSQSRPTFPFVCPIMGMEMNGVYKFAFAWSCGCLVAERAIRSLQVSVCPNCNKEFDPSDIVIVHAEGDDLELMRSRLDAKALELEETRRRKRELKAASKRKLLQNGLEYSTSHSTQEDGPENKKMKMAEVSSNPATDSVSNSNSLNSQNRCKVDEKAKQEEGGSSVLAAQKVPKATELSLNTEEMKASQSFKSLFHKHKETDNTLDPNRGFWSQTTHSYFFKGT